MSHHNDQPATLSCVGPDLVAMVFPEASSRLTFTALPPADRGPDSDPCTKAPCPFVGGEDRWRKPLMSGVRYRLDAGGITVPANVDDNVSSRSNGM
jgi:hypothetical protein